MNNTDDIILVNHVTEANPDMHYAGDVEITLPRDIDPASFADIAEENRQWFRRLLERPGWREEVLDILGGTNIYEDEIHPENRDYVNADRQRDRFDYLLLLRTGEFENFNISEETKQQLRYYRDRYKYAYSDDVNIGPTKRPPLPSSPERIGKRMLLYKQMSDAQNNPNYLEGSRQKFTAEIEDEIATWESLLGRRLTSEEIAKFIQMKNARDYDKMAGTLVGVDPKLAKKTPYTDFFNNLADKRFDEGVFNRMVGNAAWQLSPDNNTGMFGDHGVGTGLGRTVGTAALTSTAVMNPATTARYVIGSNALNSLISKASGGRLNSWGELVDIGTQGYVPGELAELINPGGRIASSPTTDYVTRSIVSEAVPESVKALNPVYRYFDDNRALAKQWLLNLFTKEGRARNRAGLEDDVYVEQLTNQALDDTYTLHNSPFFQKWVSTAQTQPNQYGISTPTLTSNYIRPSYDGRLTWGNLLIANAAFFPETNTVKMGDIPGLRLFPDYKSTLAVARHEGIHGIDFGHRVENEGALNDAITAAGHLRSSNAFSPVMSDFLPMFFRSKAFRLAIKRSPDVVLDEAYLQPTTTLASEKIDNPNSYSITGHDAAPMESFADWGALVLRMKDQETWDYRDNKPLTLPSLLLYKANTAFTPKDRFRLYFDDPSTLGITNIGFNNGFYAPRFTWKDYADAHMLNIVNTKTPYLPQVTGTAIVNNTNKK